MDILRKIEKLSHLSRETKGGAFIIAHEKSTGKFKVSFNNYLSRSKKRLKPTDFELAIDEAIEFIVSERKELDTDSKYTIY